MSDRPGFSFLICPDPELIRLEVESLVELHGEGKTWDRRAYWADDELPGAFWQDLSIPDLMGTPRLVVVRRANKFLKDSWDKLTSTLSSFNAQIWPIFCLEPAADKKGQVKPPAVLTKQKYWPVAEKRGWVWTSPGLTPRTMPDFVSSFVRRKKLIISPPVAHALADALPHDAMGAKNELEKIALAAGESGEVVKAHIALISHQADMDVFEFISSVLEGKSPERVWQKVFDNRLVSSSNSIFFSFLALMIREGRILWELGQGEKPSVWVHHTVVQRKSSLAKRLGPARLSRIWHLVLEAEFGVKTGQRTPEQAFEALVGGLYSLFSPKTAQSTR
ncbi:DNA polymerase III subunit delta [Desulfovibrio ferrophilus]|uniref:DNA polymerase III delta n=1 Tax=Desulfovibrio ferrophilus TaxID=241368 RepID=A0A2Z6B0A1_9BACT|nr:DNA polymerase III subunit delta [Desulfovibrio ferrophilus]BBD08957.1 DNA polymerase III delta [Desulfovibrio ferrophilus]